MHGKPSFNINQKYMEYKTPTTSNTLLFFDYHVNGTGAYTWSANYQEISGESDTSSQPYSHWIWAPITVQPGLNLGVIITIF
jgi:hypothetical protein